MKDKSFVTDKKPIGDYSKLSTPGLDTDPHRIFSDRLNIPASAVSIPSVK